MIQEVIEKWNEYKLAVNEMVNRTSTEYAPWSLIAAKDKLFARTQVLETICNVIDGHI